jgi:cell division protein FtsL
MNASGRLDFAILITFFVGIISIIYFLVTLLLIGSDPTLFGIPESYLSWMVVERLIFIGIIVVVLILITYILMKQKAAEETERKKTMDRARRLRSEKTIKEDLSRYYRDLGALKIILKDGALDTKTYNERKKYLDDMIKLRKKQLDELKGR